MSRLPNEDLFEGSKMSFGEHLEELRVALVRSLFGVVIGVVIGFFFAEKVIDVIVNPLEKAIRAYYVDKTTDTIVERFGADMSAEDVESLRGRVAERGLVVEDLYIERSEMRRALETVDENESANTPAGGASSEPGMPTLDDFVKIRVWRDTSNKIQSIATTEGFFAWMKVGIISGLTIAAPWIFWQLWVFVAEGLYPTEKKYVYIYMPFSLILFFAGASLAYFFVFEPVLGFLLSFNDTMNADPNLRISEWLGFFLMLPLGFGIGFQLPLVMLFLNRIGVMSVEAYISQWRIAILVIFMAAMLLTPADPQSMLLLAMPLTILYFLGIALCKFLPKRQSPYGEGYDPA